MSIQKGSKLMDVSKFILPQLLNHETWHAGNFQDIFLKSTTYYRLDIKENTPSKIHKGFELQLLRKSIFALNQFWSPNNTNA